MNAIWLNSNIPIQLTRNCVIQEEAKKASYKHVGGQQYV